MSKEDIKNDPRFADAPQGKDAVKLSDSGIANIEDLGDGLAKVTDRDGRVSVLPVGEADAVHLSKEQRQKAIDTLVENSPGENESNPAHSKYNDEAFRAPSGAEDDSNSKVVNANLGVDKQNQKSGK